MPEQWRQDRIRFGDPNVDEPVGYGRHITIHYLPAARQPIAPAGVREWAGPGVKFEAMPAQVAPATQAITWGLPRGSPVTAAGYRSLVISWWVLVLGSSMLPAMRAWRWCVRIPRAEQNVCVDCGYDLRATPDRCPECGTIPTR